jgi:plasmid stability protein
VGGTLDVVTELHVRIPDDLAESLASEAAERGVSSEDLAAEVLRAHVPSESSPRANQFSFIGIGRAKPGFSARKAEERLEAEGFV